MTATTRAWCVFALIAVAMTAVGSQASVREKAVVKREFTDHRNGGVNYECTLREKDGRYFIEHEIDGDVVLTVPMQVDVDKIKLARGIFDTNLQTAAAMIETTEVMHPHSRLGYRRYASNGSIRYTVYEAHSSLNHAILLAHRGGKGLKHLPTITVQRRPFGSSREVLGWIDTLCKEKAR